MCLCSKKSLCLPFFSMKSIFTSLLLIFNGLLVFGQSPNLYFPPKTGSVWQTTSPASLNFCPERIDSLYDFLAKTDTKGFLLLKDGRIVLEKYFGTFVQDSVWYWASAGKTATAFLAGQAQEKGLLKISDKSSKYLGAGWTTCPTDKENLITVRHQLTMTTGLDDTLAWSPQHPDLQNCTDPTCLKFKADAGTRWAYHNPPYLLLHDVLEAASGQNINIFTKNNLFDPTGMKGLWVNGVLFSTPRTMARYGLLLQAHGIWNGDTLLHDPNYFQEMTHVSQNLNKSYGYLTWLNGGPSFMVPAVQFVFPGKLMPAAPADIFAALGKNDQKIHVVPSKGWVVIRMGNDGGGTSQGGLAVPIAYDNELWKRLNNLECTTPTAEVVEKEGVVHIFPNPSSAGWQVESDFDFQKIELADAFGRVLKSEKNISGREFFLKNDGLASGVYFLKIFAGRQVLVREIFVSN